MEFQHPNDTVRISPRQLLLGIPHPLPHGNEDRPRMSTHRLIQDVDLHDWEPQRLRGVHIIVAFNDRADLAHNLARALPAWTRKWFGKKIMDKLFIDVTGDSASYDFPVDENGVWTGAWKTADEIQYNAPALAVDFDHLLKLEDPSAPKKKLRFGGASSVGDMDEFSTGGATRVEGAELPNRPNIFGETDCWLLVTLLLILLIWAAVPEK